MTLRFSEKIVWITGASSGIDEALALGWSREGARVILSSRNEEELVRIELPVMRYSMAIRLRSNHPGKI